MNAARRALPGRSARGDSLAKLARELEGCRRCPRLASWREEVARRPPPALRSCAYWARPVPGFGDERPWLLIVGLAPGAHGANRTGRPFTGDGAGPFLYGALHRAGLASAAVSSSRDDGLLLSGTRITNAVRCAPPGNRPAPREVERCLPFLRREWRLLGRPPVLLCLGEVAWRAALRLLHEEGFALPRPRPRFRHGLELALPGGAPRLMACYHPSLLNTRTGRLTPPMLDAVLARVRI